MGNKCLFAKLRRLLARYQEIELLVQIGEYKRGNDAEADEALDKIAAIRRFLQQKTHEHLPFEATCKQLSEALS